MDIIETYTFVCKSTYGVITRIYPIDGVGNPALLVGSVNQEQKSKDVKTNFLNADGFTRGGGQSKLVNYECSQRLRSGR